MQPTPYKYQPSENKPEQILQDDSKSKLKIEPEISSNTYVLSFIISHHPSLL